MTGAAEDNNFMKRNRSRKRTDSAMSEEDREENRKRRSKECIGAGFTNSEWLVAIDNAGEILCLHTADSVRLINKPKLGKLDIAEDEHETDSKSKTRIVSELHCYSGARFTTHTRL